MWGNPRPGNTRCASHSEDGVFRPDTAVTREDIAPHESHDTPGRRARALTGGPAEAPGRDAPQTPRRCRERAREAAAATAGRAQASAGADTRQAWSEPPSRGRRDCMWSLSRIGRVRSSPSMPSGTVHVSRDDAGRSERPAGETPATTGTRPVSTAPGARWRPAAPGAGVAADAPSGAR